MTKFITEYATITTAISRAGSARKSHAQADRKSLIHRSLGEIEVNCLNLESEDATQRLLWFTRFPGLPPSRSSNCSR